MALAMKTKKPVISLNGWEICGAFQAEDPEDVAEFLDRIYIVQKGQKMNG